MKTISRYIMTLVALFAMTAGAWAIGISCSPSYIGRVICTDGSIFVSSTEAAAEGKTAVAVIAYVNTVNKTGLALALTNQGQMNWENAKTSCADKNTSTPVTGGTWKLPSQSEWSQMIEGLGGYTAMNNVFASFGGDNLTSNYWSSTPNGNDKAVYYRSSNGGWGATSRTQNAVFVRACLEFNINLFISDDMTEATFAMPAFDATAEYELVRDLATSTKVDLIIGTGSDAVTATADTRLRIAKSNNVYAPISALSCNFVDQIENTTIAATAFADAKLTPLFYLQGENDAWTLVTDINTTTKLPNNLQPGQVYCITLKAADGSYYDGETQPSYTVTLFEGYPVEVPAGEYVTYYRTDDNLVIDEQFAEVAKLYTITSVNSTAATATATEITSANKEMPFLVYNGSDDKLTILLIPTEAETNQSFFNGFIGTTEATTIAASNASADNYAFNGKEFVWVKNAIAVGANKAWLTISTGNPSARALTIVFDDTTRIDSAVRTNDNSNDDYYDLNGRKLNGKPTRKGVYIQNGKKVVVK